MTAYRDDFPSGDLAKLRQSDASAFDGPAVLANGRSGPLAISAISLFGLWAWEAAQMQRPGGTCDLHDLAWTVPGLALDVVVRLFLPTYEKIDPHA